MSLRVYFPATASLLRDYAQDIQAALDYSKWRTEVRREKVLTALQSMLKAFQMFYGKVNPKGTGYRLSFLEAHNRILTQLIFEMAEAVKVRPGFDNELRQKLRAAVRKFVAELKLRRYHPDGEAYKSAGKINGKGPKNLILEI